MRARGTLALAAAFGALCLAYWLVQTREEQQIAEKIEAKRVFDFDAGAVTAIEIQRIGEAASAASLGEDGKWLFTKPHDKMNANQLVWPRVADTISVLRNERTIADSQPADLEQYGLADPALTVYATTSGGEIRLDFGAVEPTQTYRYAMLDKATVFLVDNEKQFFELNRPLDDLRDRFLVDNREANVMRIEYARIFSDKVDGGLENPPPPGTESILIAVERDAPDAPWRMVSPLAAPADQQKADALAAELQFAVGRKYQDAPESLMDYGLEPPAARITVVDDDSQKAQTIFFGHFDKAEDGGLFVKRAKSPSVFTIDAHIMSLLPETPMAIRAHQLLVQPVADIQQLDYNGPEGKFVLQRSEDDSWRVSEPAFTDANPNAISNFIARLKRSEASDFLDGAPEDYGLDKAEVQITITPREGAQSEIRLRRNPDNEEYYFATQDGGGLCILPAPQAEGLIVAPGAFRSRSLFRIDARQAVQLTFTLEGTEYALDKVHETWIVRRPAGHRLLNQADAKTILDAVSSLNAARPALSEESEGAGDTTPVLSFKATLTDESGELTEAGPLRVGPVSPSDSRYRIASAAGREGLWAVEQTLIEAFREAVRGIQPTEEAP